MADHHFPWRNAFLAALREYPVVQHACDVVGIERSTAYRARHAHEDFAEAWDDAMEAGVDRAEREAFRRGVVGFEEPVVYQGQLTPVWARDAEGELIREPVEVGKYPAGHEKAGEPVVEMRPVQARDANGQPVWLTVRKHSDALLSLILKGRRKKLYAERTELTGADGGPVKAVDETARSARIAALMELARRRKTEQDFSDLA